MGSMILCCGEALIDMLPCRTDGGAKAFAPHSGGGAFNTAIALGRLGVPTGLMCALSRDLFGVQLAEDLAASGVSTLLCPRVDRPTTLAFVSLHDGQARYAFHDENTALRAMTAAEMPALGAEITALVLGGISLVAEPCGSAFEAFARREAPGRVVMLDPNIRPGFITDEAAYRARLGRLMGLADILKLSDEDLAWLMPGRAESEAVATLREAGPALVVLTRGAAGARAHHAGGVVDMPAVAVHTVDTVGAGDTFNAGFLAHLAEIAALTRAGLRALTAANLGAALRFGVRAAAISVSRAGANPPWLAEMG